METFSELWAMPFLSKAGRIRKFLLITTFIINYNFCKWQSCFASEFFFSRKSHLYHKTFITYYWTVFLSKGNWRQIWRRQLMKSPRWRRPSGTSRTPSGRRTLPTRLPRPGWPTGTRDPTLSCAEMNLLIDSSMRWQRLRWRSSNLRRNWRSVREDREICRVLD